MGQRQLPISTAKFSIADVIELTNGFSTFKYYAHIMFFFVTQHITSKLNTRGCFFPIDTNCGKAFYRLHD